MSAVNPRIPLTPDRVLRAALDLADREGLGSLTMRRLGESLGVEAMSLYNHVASKEAILAGILDLVAVEMLDAPLAEDWRASARASALIAHDTLLRHPWAALLWVSRPSAGPARLDYMEGVLTSLRTADFPPLLHDRAFHTIQNHVIGHAMQRAAFGMDGDALAAGAASFLATLDQTAHPELAAHVRWHLDRHADAEADDDEFAFGLELILDGLERLRRGD